MKNSVMTMVVPARRSERFTAGGRASEGRAAPAIKLTRRGRLVVRWFAGLGVALVSTVAVLVAVALLGGSAQASPSTQSVSVSYHVMVPGETLWELAATVDPEADPRDVVERVLELNDLQTANVRAGTRLRLPVD